MASRLNSVKKDSKKDEQEKSFIKVDSFEIVRAKDTDYGIAFDATINGITFYGMFVKLGSNGDFISFPSRKYEDKHYRHYYIPFTEEDANKIMDAVVAKANE